MASITISPYVLPGIKDFKLEPEPVNYIRIDHKTKDALIVAVIESVCKYFGVDYNKISSNSRNAYIVEPRRMICYYLYESRFKFTLKEIGDIIGYYNHATVLYHIGKVNNFLDAKDKQTIADLEKLDKLINYQEVKC